MAEDFVCAKTAQVPPSALPYSAETPAAFADERRLFLEMEEKGRPGNSCGLTDIAHCRRGITLRGKESYRAIVDVAAGPLALADRAAGRFLDDTHCHVITLSQPISRHPSNSYGNGSLDRKSTRLNSSH